MTDRNTSIGSDVLRDIAEKGTCSVYWGASNLLWIAHELVRRRAEVERLSNGIGRIAAAVLELRAKASRQRRELRRLNKTLKALWAGARFQVNVMAEQRAKHVDVESAKPPV